MSCTNCYNGCQEITSDKCVKYTGLDIPLLGIKNGDSLTVVEQALIGFLSDALTGEAIVPTIDPQIICQIVTDNLATCEDVTLNNLLSALIKSICQLQESIDTINGVLTTLNGNYDTSCLGNAPNEGTHAILQSVIDKLCALSTDFDAFVQTVDTNYVKLADLPQLIQDYLDSIAPGVLFCNKMVPFTVVEYYGDLTGYPTINDGFGVSGAGYGAWANVYLCNGKNGTPDKRGRVGVGAADMGGDPLDADRTAYPYTKNVPKGANTVTLNSNQMPAHSHGASSVVTDPQHFHYEFADVVNGTVIAANSYPVRAKDATGGASNLEYEIQGGVTLPTLGRSSSSGTGVSVATTIASIGGGQAHSNIQPGLGCYYIMYIP